MSKSCKKNFQLLPGFPGVPGLPGVSIPTMIPFSSGSSFDDTILPNASIGFGSINPNIGSFPSISFTSSLFGNITHLNIAVATYDISGPDITLIFTVATSPPGSNIYTASSLTGTVFIPNGSSPAVYTIDVSGSVPILVGSGIALLVSSGALGMEAPRITISGSILIT